MKMVILVWIPVLSKDFSIHVWIFIVVFFLLENVFDSDDSRMFFIYEHVHIVNIGDLVEVVIII